MATPMFVLFIFIKNMESDMAHSAHVIYTRNEPAHRVAAQGSAIGSSAQALRQGGIRS